MRRTFARLSGREYVLTLPVPLEPRIAIFDRDRVQELGYSSQFGQDVLLDAFFTGIGVRRGVFVDVGAHNGVTGSNTHFFEQVRGWRGICIEPLPGPFAQLEASRSARCINCAVGDTEGQQEFLAVEGYGEMLSGLIDEMDPRHIARIEADIAEWGGSKQIVTVPVRRLDEILDDCGIDSIDLMSLDVEGGELSVLRSLDLARTPVLALAVENGAADDSVARYLAEQTGLRRILRIDVDDIYVDLSLLRTRLMATGPGRPTDRA